MAEAESTSINFDRVQSIMGEWDSSVGSFDPKSASSDETISALASLGLESGFSESYDKNFTSLKEGLQSIGASVKGSLNDFLAAETRAKNKRPGGGTTPTDEQDQGILDARSVEDIKTDQITQYEQMTMEDLTSIAEELTKLAAEEGVSLEQLLTDEAYKEKLTDLLASSRFISDDLKKLILESDVASQEALRDIANGVYPEVVGFYGTTRMLYESYLENIAKENNITLDDLLNKDEYKGLLKEAFKSFGEASTELSNLDDEGIKSKIEQVKDGQFGNMSAGVKKIFEDFTQFGLEGDDIIEAANGLSRFGVLATITAARTDEEQVGVARNLLGGFEQARETKEPTEDVGESAYEERPESDKDDIGTPAGSDEIGDVDVAIEDHPADSFVVIEPQEDTIGEEFFDENVPINEDLVVEQPADEQIDDASNLYEEVPVSEDIQEADSEPQLEDFADDIEVIDDNLPVLDEAFEEETEEALPTFD